jgi:uncharacterized protein YdeI (YjbR/CyaY-like superfamily)
MGAASRTSPKVDAFFQRTTEWRDELAKLREIILESELEEVFKWGWPCYALGGHNVLLIHAFKDYCAILVMKGALLDDPAGILVQQTENVQSARQIRLTSVREIAGMENVLKDYIQRAIEAEKSGAKVAKKTTAQFAVPEEFQRCLDADHALKAAFEALTPGRQRGYLLFFGSAKRAETREARIEKNIPRIFDGLGIDD